MTTHLINAKHKQPSLTPLQTHLLWSMGGLVYSCSLRNLTISSLDTWLMRGTLLYYINMCSSRANIDGAIRKDFMLESSTRFAPKKKAKHGNTQLYSWPACRLSIAVNTIFYVNLLKCQTVNDLISDIIFIIHQLQYVTLLVVNILSLILLMFILVLNSQSRLQIVLLNTTLFDAYYKIT